MHLMKRQVRKKPLRRGRRNAGTAEKSVAERDMAGKDAGAAAGSKGRVFVQAAFVWNARGVPDAERDRQPPGTGGG